MWILTRQWGRSFLQVGFVVLLVGSGASATVTDFTWNPENPVLGSTVTYNATDDGMHPVVSYKWEYRVTDGGCTSGWSVGSSTNSSQTWTHSFPGTLDVKMTATYSPFANKAPTVITKQVVIPKADGFVITSGLNLPTNNDPTGATYLAVTIKVQCGGVDAGSMIAAIAQEKLTDITLLGNAQPDSAWVPDQPSSSFYLQGNVIVDNKFSAIPAFDWNTIAVNQVYFTATQHLRLKYSDSCGNVKTMDLGSFDYKMRKVSATQWQMEQ